MDKNDALNIKEALEDKLARDILILEIGPLTTIGDYMIIADASNVNQLDALENAVYDKMAKEKKFPKNTEGKKESGWILMDYGDIIVIDNDYAYDIDENGDPVKVNIDGNRLKECIIKRVIATPGQEIDLRDGKVYIDGKEIDEPYIASDAQTLPEDAFSGKYPFKVPDGYYFVMGDNREHSSDSRNSGVGLIKKDQIYGKAIVRYQPIKDFKLLGNSVNESAN